MSTTKEQFDSIMGNRDLSRADRIRQLEYARIPFRLKAGKVVLLEFEEQEYTRNVLSCLDEILEKSVIKPESHAPDYFNKAVFEEAREAFDYVCGKLSLTRRQVLLLAHSLDSASHHSCGIDDLADNMSMGYLSLMAWDEDFKALEKAGYIRILHDGDIKVLDGVRKCLMEDRPVTREEIRGISPMAFLSLLRRSIKEADNDCMSTDFLLEEVRYMMKCNPDLAFVREVDGLGLGDSELIMVCALTVMYQFNNDDDVSFYSIEDLYDYEDELDTLKSMYRANKLVLQKAGVVEPVNMDGVGERDRFHLSREWKDRLLAECGGARAEHAANDFKVVRSGEIVEREMFYNRVEENLLGRLERLLKEENYRHTCERLKEKGLRTGFTCLFYGGPGTGKTETVYQIARRTGRDIIPVNVNEIKSCWVGESEKHIKEVFDSYRSLARKSDLAPILLFNEADAILGLRMEGATRAVDKMENSLQNIILQEMEKLDGILIATTNLTENLDRAFERRFLYKIEFRKPQREVNARIWQSMIPDLTPEQAERLSVFPFSGGQIENITRKREIKYILDAEQPAFEEILEYCSEEKISSSDTAGRKVGFHSV